ncbi:hypothetical protein K0M31_004257 [Melipona bicolor]|uniref:Uncharacterized protein n=1 Tax=Melipona bicolor TaxID=60889 RepID=A0AA40FX43_9HYME|nr:hypothetical protein K0M31_004257 [Melipona bicolor]
MDRVACSKRQGNSVEDVKQRNIATLAQTSQECTWEMISTSTGSNRHTTKNQRPKTPKPQLQKSRKPKIITSAVLPNFTGTREKLKDLGD